MRMLLNNLDPEVAERPEDLVVYGGSGKAARNPEALEAIIDAAEATWRATRRSWCSPGSPSASSGRTSEPRGSSSRTRCSCRRGRTGTSSTGSKRSA